MLCVYFKSLNYLVFFLGRTMILLLDQLRALEPNLIDAAQFLHRMMVDATEFIFFIFQSFHITQGSHLQMASCLFWYGVSSVRQQEVRGRERSISTTDGCADMVGKLTSNIRGPDFDPVLGTLFCTWVTLGTSISSPHKGWIKEFFFLICESKAIFLEEVLGWRLGWCLTHS